MIYLVYEVNEQTFGECDLIEKSELKAFTTLDEALDDANSRVENHVCYSLEVEEGSDSYFKDISSSVTLVGEDGSGFMFTINIAEIPLDGI